LTDAAPAAKKGTHMGSVIGDILPLALGIAISPIPIIAAILMLLSPKAKGTSVGFMLGWLLGIVIAVIVFTLLASVLPGQDPDASNPIAAWIKIVLGVGLLFLALRQWRGRPKAGEEAALPKWMAAIDTMTAGRGFVLGFLLSAVNPKNLLMAIGAGVIIGSGGLTVGETTLVIVIFVLIAACSVAIPVIAYLVASARMAAPLESLRAWLVHNNATVMAVLLLVIGVVVIGKGIGSF
jgi:threonine/homoserine/homoserine lactone efflux protein